MSTLKYTKSHEWILVEGEMVTIGITDYAQEQLGDVVFVDLPEEGRELVEGEEAAVIESVKAAGEINSPVSGTVVAINTVLADAPDTVNQDPTGDGWFFKLKIDAPIDDSEWLDEEGYNTYVEDEC
ncbi:MAG: glycine cleavage system protein GcvH [Pseudomonadales bacterium]|jgi:glycine cleavage system H protein|nr:glycine cleavage system protein GcvH [Pseudomonadales bacterium]MCP5216396.1 glycine cleavage system protein GcvH [Pseudomonadales bacterium]